MVDKPKLNFIIDALMFLVIVAMAGFGFLMKYVLIPGKERHVKYGRNVDLTFLGWDRHDWGDLHLYLGFILLGLLVLHIILHWKQIVGLFQRLIPPERRTLVLLVFVLLAVLLIYFPFLVSPEVGELGRGLGRIHR
jgi:cytochrome b561